MEFELKILDTAVLLLEMLEYFGDEELNDYVINAVYNNDTMALYDLKDSLEQDYEEEDDGEYC